MNETNWERLQREAGVTDPMDPEYNSDMDITLPGGGGKTYRDLTLAGYQSNERGVMDYLKSVEGNK